MENRINRKGIIYGVIGIVTLMISVIGATFAYFTAADTNTGTITGNMATIKLSLGVEKVVNIDEVKKGMIPMSNGMVEVSLASNVDATNHALYGSDNAGSGVCLDDNGNAVCQIYKITLSNASSAGQFVDGYVSLRYGSGAPTDYTGTWKDGAKFVNATKTADSTNGVGTTMRWAQVFPVNKVVSSDTVVTYSTAGTQSLGSGSNEKISFTSIGAAVAADGDTVDQAAAKAHNRANIRTIYSMISTPNAEGGSTVNNQAVLDDVSIAGTSYKVIGTNYIRISNHDWTQTGSDGNQSYDRDDDVTSALVFNHSIPAGESVDYYIVVWLSETGTNQTASTTVDGVTNPAALNFFDGNVTFISAQGSEVSATFSGYTRVSSQS